LEVGFSPTEGEVPPSLFQILVVDISFVSKIAATLSPAALLILIFIFLQLVFMDDKRDSNTVTYWCYAKEQGKEMPGGAPVPCRKEACDRYRAESPFCTWMERVDWRGFVIPERVACRSR
jgi:hypothetical protein